MQSDDDAKISLHIDGVVCDTWDDLSVDSDIGVPADGFSFSWFDAQQDVLPDHIKAGQHCHITCDKTTILTGILDSINQVGSRSGLNTNLSGRDLAGQLIDCHAPIDAATNLTLSELIQRYVTGGNLSSLPITIGSIDTDWLKGRTGVDVGESIWDVLSAAAQASGQYVWMSPSGQLMVGNPFDVQQPSNKPGLKFFNDDRCESNNVLDVNYRHDISNAFSTVEIVGQTTGGKNFRGKATDNRLSLNRYRVQTDSRADTQAEAEKFAAKAMADGWIEATSLTVLVSGWLYEDKPWQTGWAIDFESNVVPRANGEWVIFGRTFQLSRSNAKTTELRMHRLADWMQPVKYADLIKN